MRLCYFYIESTCQLYIRRFMPFLCCVDKTDQSDLVKVLPQLYDDPSDSKLDTLKQYHVKWTHGQMEKQQPNTDFDHYLLKRMCEDARCMRDCREAHAIELYKMTSDD